MNGLKEIITKKLEKKKNKLLNKLAKLLIKYVNINTTLNNLNDLENLEVIENKIVKPEKVLENKEKLSDIKKRIIKRDSELKNYEGKLEIGNSKWSKSNRPNQIPSKVKKEFLLNTVLGKYIVPILKEGVPVSSKEVLDKLIKNNVKTTYNAVRLWFGHQTEKQNLKQIREINKLTGKTINPSLFVLNNFPKEQMESLNLKEFKYKIKKISSKTERKYNINN